MRSTDRSLRRKARDRQLAIKSGVNISRVLRALSGLLRVGIRRTQSQPVADDELRQAQLASEHALSTQRLADADKQRQLVTESRAKTWGTHVDNVRKIVPMVALAYGLDV